MSELIFINTKYGINVKHKQNDTILPLIIQAKCMCSRSIYQEKNNYYIDISLDNEILNLIHIFDNQCKTKFQNYINSISKHNIMKVKLAYRYKKIETVFKDSDGLYITSGTIREGDHLKVELQCNTLWDINDTHGLVWKTNVIIKE